MKAKQIINIVFYNYFDVNNVEQREACIFYRDGSVKSTNYDGGLDACEEIVKERNITSTNVFKEMINKEIVHVMTAEEFKDKYANYVNHEPIDREMIDEVIVESMPKVKVKENTPIAENSEENTNNVVNNAANRLRAATAADLEAEEIDEYEFAEEDDDLVIEGSEEDEEEDYEDYEDYEDEDDYEDYDDDEEFVIEGSDENTEEATAADLGAEEIEEYEFAEEEDDDLVIEGSDENTEEETAEEAEEVEEAEAVEEEHVDTAREMAEFINNPEAEGNNSHDSSIEDANLNHDNNNNKGLFGFFRKQINKVKLFGNSVRTGILGLTVATALGGAAGYALNRNMGNGEMFASNLANSAVHSLISNDLDDVQAAGLTDYSVAVNPASQLYGVPTASSLNIVNNNLATGNNEDYDNYTYEQLLEVTNNETQKTAMTNLGTTIFEFNGDFADAYVEEDKDIRAALKVEEVEALEVAYNDYSKDELKAIFNGTEVRADKMSMDYKAASLQLMGAYVIENSENPVNMSYLLETQEGKDFYNKYHTMYLAAKEATGQDKLDKVNAFYAEVKKDFPITDDVRTEGIAHADSYATLEAYKLSVTPMIAAAEMQFQNLDIDYTLNDIEIDFINDIGLCNYADDTFERLETITLSSDVDKTNPTELQYRNSLIKVLEAENHYVIDDLHRELSKLDKFINTVNWHFETIDGYSTVTTTGGYTETETTTTSTETKEWEETSVDVKTEINVHEEEMPDEEKAKIDQEIEEENEKAKEEAEAEAEKKRQEEQAKADEEAKKKEEEVKKQNEETQKKIDDANKKIEENNKDQDTTNDKKVNEKDINANVDPEHKDENGNINDSVKDITTDGTNDKTDEELPDPNETGAEFDKNQPEYHDTTSNNTTEPTEFVDVTDYSDNTENTTDNTDNTTNETANTEYPEGTKFYDEDGNVYDSYDDLVNAYVNKLANAENATETDAKQYVK